MVCRAGWIRQLAGFASSQLCDLPHTTSHFPLPPLARLCSTWAVLAPHKHLKSTKTVKLRSLSRWTNHCRQTAANSGWSSYSKTKPSQHNPAMLSWIYRTRRGSLTSLGFACLHLHSSCMLRPLGARSTKTKPLKCHLPSCHRLLVKLRTAAGYTSAHMENYSCSAEREQLCYILYMGTLPGFF